MCFLSDSQFQTKDRDRVAVSKLTYQDTLLDIYGKEYEIVNIYKLPEYKVVKMVRISQGNLNGWHPLKTTYLKPSQYLKFGDELVKGKDLVEKFHVAEYEKYNILHFYLLNVRPIIAKEERNDIDKVEKINCFLDVNGLSMSVYNTKHPLNNRFGKYSLSRVG